MMGNRTAEGRPLDMLGVVRQAHDDTLGIGAYREPGCFALGAVLEGRSLGCGALAHASGGESCVIDEHILWLVIWNKTRNMIPGS